jgi:sugar lactone lactonase YvrE
MKRLSVLAGLIGGVLAMSNVDAGAKDVAAPIFSSSLFMNGVATNDAGRTFAPVQPASSADPQVVEIRKGVPVPFPNASWNSGEGPVNARFVGVNALRIGPDGALWIVDRGSTGIGKSQVAGAARLIRVDLANDSVSKIYDLSDAVKPESFVDDVRFLGRTAYFTDAGAPSLIVLDLDTGRTRRVLDGHASTVSNAPLMAEGRQLLDPEGKPIVVHADQMEISPDGKWFYYQPCSGGMSRIETRFLNDEKMPAEQLAAQVQPFAKTPSTGGTVIDADGNIYLSDTDRVRILKITKDGEISTLLDDPRLDWVDAMWIDRSGNLLMPAAQLNRSPGLNHGVDKVSYPISIFSFPLHAKATHN